MMKNCSILSWYVSFGRTVYTDNKCMFFAVSEQQSAGASAENGPGRRQHLMIKWSQFFSFTVHAMISALRLVHAQLNRKSQSLV